MKDLYIIENIDSQQVKIGRSDSPKERINRINNTSGVINKIELIMPNFGDFETPLHRCFNSHRTLGEWFKYNGILKSYVAFLKGNNIIENTHLEYIYIAFSKYGSNPPNHNFEQLMHDVSKDYSSALKCYNQILKERDGIGSEIKTTFLDFLDKKKIVLRYFSYHLTIENNKYIVVRENKFDETNPPDAATYQLHDMNCNTSPSFKVQSEKELQEYIDKAPFTEIYEKEFKDITLNEKEIILEHNDYDYILYKDGTGQLTGIHNDFTKTNKMICLELPYNHTEYLTFLESNRKTINRLPILGMSTAIRQCDNP